MLDTAAPPNLDYAFDQIDLGSRTALIVAVSGGSDSTALLFALSQWVYNARPGLRVTCCTIDHGLRAESALEAEQVAALCDGLNVEHRTLLWTGDKPATGLANAARSARYRLLADAARAAGTDLVVTGHTADDQAETVCMRAARASERGMAGMATATLFDRSVWIVRPFLDVRRSGLRSYLQSRNIAWIDDPTNDDRRYERTRVRQQLRRDDGSEQLLTDASTAGQDRRSASAQSASLIDRHATIVAPGLVRLDRTIAQDNDINLDAVRYLLACCGGSPRPSSREDTRRFLDRLESGRVCLTGTIATATKDAVYLHRELRRDRPLQTNGGVFDRRYTLSDADRKAGWCLKRRTDDEGSVPEFEFDRSVARLAKAAFRAEPVPVHVGAQNGANVASPALYRHLAPFDHFLPDFDLTLAIAIGRLFGRNDYPHHR